MDRRIQEIQSLSPELAKHFEDVQLLLDKNDAIIKACEQVPKSCCRFLSPSRRVRCVSCLAPGAVIRAVCLWLGDGSRLGRDRLLRRCPCSINASAMLKRGSRRTPSSEDSS